MNLDISVEKISADFLYYKDPSYRDEMFSFNSERLFSVKSVQSIATAFLVLNCKIQSDYI